MGKKVAAEVCPLIKRLNQLGIGLYIQEDEENLIARPRNLLTDELRTEIREKRKEIYIYLIRQDLRKLLQLIEMAGVLDSVPIGLQEDWASAIISAKQSAGNVWS